MIMNWTVIKPGGNEEKTPMALNHVDWAFCWCDPILETDQNGREVVIHKEVTWN